MSAKQQVSGIVKRAKKKMLLTFRGTALSMFGHVVIRTPVLSGRARGNWQTELNHAPDGVLDTVDKSGSATISNAGAQVNRAQLGDSIFFINNLPYIKKLEDGSSDQAPSGMVKTTVADFQSLAKQNARRNR